MAADPLHAAIERFLGDRDERALLAAVQEYGGRAPSNDADWPDQHRICDVKLGGFFFRVTRVLDTVDHTSKLYIYPTDVPQLDQPGVPFGLQGDALARWVEDETRSPTKGPVRWSRYLASLQDGA
jgi:hypothetical protein